VDDDHVRKIVKQEIRESRITLALALLKVTLLILAAMRVGYILGN